MCFFLNSKKFNWLSTFFLNLTWEQMRVNVITSPISASLGVEELHQDLRWTSQFHQCPLHPNPTCHRSDETAQNLAVSGILSCHAVVVAMDSGGGGWWQLWLWYFFDLGDALYTMTSSENQINHGSFSSRSPSIQMFTEQRDLRENQRFVKGRDISGISEQTHILKTPNSFLRLCYQPWNPEKSRSILDKILRVCDSRLPNSITKKTFKNPSFEATSNGWSHSNHPKPATFTTIKTLWCSDWKF